MRWWQFMTPTPVTEFELYTAYVCFNILKSKSKGNWNERKNNQSVCEKICDLRVKNINLRYPKK